MKLKTKNFYDILNKVSLSGLISDCFLEIKEGGDGKVSTLDLTRSIFIQAESKIAIDDKSCKNILQLKEIGKFYKFIGDIKEKEETVKIEIKENRLCLFTKSKGTVKFLLGEVEENQQNKTQKGIDKILESVKNRKELKMEKVNEILYFINLFNCEELQLRIKNGEMSIGSLENAIQTFSISMGEEKVEDSELRFNAQFFKAIMSTIKWTSKYSPIMFYRKDSPIVFQQGKALWILALIS